jgi:uncharacterized protein DUF488/NnrS protein
MIVAVMPRVTRGHTGRELTADRATVAMFVLINAAALARVASWHTEFMILLLLVAGGLLDRGLRRVRVDLRRDARKTQSAMKHPPPQQLQWPDGAIFTVGHSTLPIERFITLLQTYGIERLADVRTVPRSRHNPQFNADELGRALAHQNIDYVPLHTLGGLRHARGAVAVAKGRPSRQLSPSPSGVFA